MAPIKNTGPVLVYKMSILGDISFLLQFFLLSGHFKELIIVINKFYRHCYIAGKVNISFIPM